MWGILPAMKRNATKHTLCHDIRYIRLDADHETVSIQNIMQFAVDSFVFSVQ